MSSVQTRLFKSNRSQAVRLPKQVAFPESVKDVEITAIGNKRIIAPAGQSRDDWFDAPGVSSDFMTDRGAPWLGRGRKRGSTDQTLNIPLYPGFVISYR
jgi:antitoxin VapB